MNILILGGSAGLGFALAKGMPSKGDCVWVASRTKPKFPDIEGVSYRWIELDLSRPESIDNILAVVGEEVIDTLVYAAGTWESNRDIWKVSSRELYEILSVNCSGFVACVSALKSNLASASRGVIIAISSIAGLENATGPRAAFAASKFGIRGAAHALRDVFRGDGVAVCCICPGGLASDVEYTGDCQKALEKYNNTRIPAEDMVKMARMVVSMSPASCIKEIIVPAQYDEEV